MLFKRQPFVLLRIPFGYILLHDDFFTSIGTQRNFGRHHRPSQIDHDTANPIHYWRFDWFSPLPKFSRPAQA